MQAKETSYGGIQFRSRLEAKWAAFFDGIGWRWEYEALDFPGYIPDFLFPDFREPLLLEVKPEITDEAKRKIERCGWTGPAMVVGSGPFPSNNCNGWALGHLSERNESAWNWEEGILACGSPSDKLVSHPCENNLGMVHSLHSYHCRRCGGYNGNVCASEIDVEGIWRTACNATRWTPKAPAIVRIPTTVPSDKCAVCACVVTNSNFGGFGRDRDGVRVFYCLPCCDNLARDLPK